MTTPRLSLPALAVLALAACAHAPRERLSAAVDGSPSQDRTLAEETRTPAQPERVLVTGSRIRQRVDPATGRVPTSMSPLTIITRERIVASGSADLAAALLRLDPTLTRP